MNQIWNIGGVLEWTINYFTEKSIPSPRLDAELLLAHVLKVERVQLYMRYEEPLSKDQLSQYHNLIKERANLHPVAYLLGNRAFYKQELLVNSDVLIPRPETEFLVGEVLKWLDEKQQVNALEMGTGSGNISIALAHENPQINIITFEKSNQAAHVAEQNIAQYDLQDRIDLRVMDYLRGFSELVDAEQKFDLLFSNPPYINRDQIKHVDPSTLNYEPHDALFADDCGLIHYKEFARWGEKLLAEGALVALEVGFDQSEKVQSIFSQEGGYKLENIIRDYNGIERVISWIKC